MDVHQSRAHLRNSVTHAGHLQRDVDRRVELSPTAIHAVSCAGLMVSMGGAETAVEGYAQSPDYGHVRRRPERCDLGLAARACFMNDTGLGEAGPAARSVQGTQIDSSLIMLPIASRATNRWCSVRLRQVSQRARCSSVRRRTAVGPSTELIKSGIRRPTSGIGELGRPAVPPGTRPRVQPSIAQARCLPARVLSVG
jgi:hypothetical protein